MKKKQEVGIYVHHTFRKMSLADYYPVKNLFPIRQIRDAQLARSKLQRVKKVFTFRKEVFVVF